MATMPNPLPQPRNGEYCGELVYDAQWGVWLYPASYDDFQVCMRRALVLATAWSQPFDVCRLDLASAITDDPGYYAYTTEDPRPKAVRA